MNSALIASVYGSVPDEAMELFDRLLQEPKISAEELRAQVDAHLSAIREAAKVHDFVPLAVGEALAKASHALLDDLDALSDDRRQLAQVAIRYFVLDDDADSDMGSATGLDDDAEVMNLVLDALGRRSWKVELRGL